jgi:hypothetical protein
LNFSIKSSSCSLHPSHTCEAYSRVGLTYDI